VSRTTRPEIQFAPTARLGQCTSRRQHVQVTSPKPTSGELRVSPAANHHAIQFPVPHKFMLPRDPGAIPKVRYDQRRDIRFRFGTLWSYGQGSKRYGR
jgi:hypothetical protein